MKRLGRLAWRAIRFEVRIDVALARWVFRRPSVPADADVARFGYGQGVVPVLWSWVFASAAEIPVVHVLLPWRSAQTVAFVVSAWGLFWMLGFLASHKVYPHLLTATGLVVRHGPHTRVEVAWADVANVVAERRDLPSSARAFQPTTIDDGTVIRVGVSGETNVRVVLHHATVVPTPRGRWKRSRSTCWSTTPPRSCGSPAHGSPTPSIRRRCTAEVPGLPRPRDGRPIGVGQPA